MDQKIESTKDNIDSLVDRTRDAVGVVANRAELGVETAAAGVVDRTHKAGEYLRDKVETTARGMHRGLDETAKSIDRTYVKAKADLSRATVAANGYVAENPGKSLLFAALGGFVIGFIAHRRLKLA